MHILKTCLSQALVLVSFLLSMPLVKAQGIGSCADDESGLEAATSDGPTSDKSAGIGVEFECGSIKFTSVSNECDEPSTYASKGKMIAGRGLGQNWALTADTQAGSPNYLNAEYIIDGRVVKIGSGDAGRAATAIAADLAAWNPSTHINLNSFDIDQSTCNPWKIYSPVVDNSFGDLSWAPQVTAPMPLEAISDLFAKNAAEQPHVLLTSKQDGSIAKQMISVTNDFFQSSPNGISSTAVKDDVLGFFSLIISYAKGAGYFEEGESPKMLTTIMPRTDFTTIYSQVKGDIPGTLYNIVKVLACYKYSGFDIVIDTDYCSGTVEAPVTGTKMDGQEFVFQISEVQDLPLKVSDWINGIEDGTVPDGLTTLDTNVDSSIGGLGAALENLYGTSTRAVPLFEFRNLVKAQSADFETRVDQFEQAIIAYHNAHLNVPREIVKRVHAKYSHIKRAAPSAGACPTLVVSANVTSTPASVTPAPTPSCELHNEDPDEGINQAFCLCDNSITLIVLSATSAQSESCAYKSIPAATTAREIVTTQTEVYTNTSNCAVCTVAGGAAGQETCTTIPVPSCYPQVAKVTVQVGTSPVHVGTLTGDALYTSISSALEELCPSVTQTTSSTQCSETDTIYIGKIPYVEDDNLQLGNLEVTVKSSQYNVTSLRDAMIHSAARTAKRSATGQNCYNATYQADILKRHSDFNSSNELSDLKIARDHVHPVEETIFVCNVGDFAGVQYFGQYYETRPGATDYLDANLAFQSAGEDFWCGFIDELMDDLAVIQPEFAFGEVEVQEEIQAICMAATEN